jgi:hypothetical protein
MCWLKGECVWLRCLAATMVGVLVRRSGDRDVLCCGVGERESMISQK